MGLTIVRADITTLSVDAIVNTANPRPIVGTGVDKAIYDAAGHDALLNARKKIGNMLIGEAKITDAFALHAKKVIHVVGPGWKGGDDGELEVLKKCYTNALQVAWDNHCYSVAFPLLATGNCGFPKGPSLLAAENAISAFLIEKDYPLDIQLVVYGDEATALATRLHGKIKSYINKKNVKEGLRREYTVKNGRVVYVSNQQIYKNYSLIQAKKESVSQVCWKTSQTPPTTSEAVASALKHKSLSTSEILQSLITHSGKNSAKVALDARLDGSVISNILNGKTQIPKKDTILQIAFALRLDIQPTQSLLASAGYILSDSIDRDIIIKLAICNQIFDMDKLNSQLSAQALQPLGPEK